MASTVYQVFAFLDDLRADDLMAAAKRAERFTFTERLMAWTCARQCLDNVNDSILSTLYDYDPEWMDPARFFDYVARIADEDDEYINANGLLPYLHYSTVSCGVVLDIVARALGSAPMTTSRIAHAKKFMLSYVSEFGKVPSNVDALFLTLSRVVGKGVLSAPVSVELRSPEHLGDARSIMLTVRAQYEDSRGDVNTAFAVAKTATCDGHVIAEVAKLALDMSFYVFYPLVMTRYLYYQVPAEAMVKRKAKEAVVAARPLQTARMAVRYTR